MKVIVLDTETTNSIEEPIAYDIGWAVLDLETGEILKTESYTIAEIFLDKELMSYAYFADKIPTYWEEIKHGDRKLARLSTIYKTLYADCRSYEVSEIYGHNVRFDYRSCNLTSRFISNSKYRYFLPFGLEVKDTLKMSREAFGKDEVYRNFCIENGYVTKNGQNRYTAEVLYRFLTGNNDFEEVHQGIDDVLIEYQILLACRERGVVDGSLW